jgi:hypothetical protein
LTKYLELFLRGKDIQNMRIESKKIFDSKFNLKRSVDDYFDIYQKLIG